MNNDLNKIGTKNNNDLQTNVKANKQPDEKSGVHIEAKIKIFDPETNEIYLDGRA
jgi:hypothetical protein